MKILKQNGMRLQKLYQRDFVTRKKHVEERVRRIIDDVQKNGDEAVIKYTRRFDKVKMDPKALRVAENEISGAFQNITSDFITDLKTIIRGIVFTKCK